MSEIIARYSIWWSCFSVLILATRISTAADNIVRHSDSATLVQTFSIDLDDFSEDRRLKDLRFEAVSEKEFYLSPIQGARAMLFGKAQPSEGSCGRLTMTTERIPIAALAPGMHLCILTNAGRIGEIRIDRLKPLDHDFVRDDLSTLASITFSFIVWEKRK